MLETPFEQWLLDEGVAYVKGPKADPMKAAKAAWDAAMIHYKEENDNPTPQVECEE
jgi:hypothetical protein